MSVEERLSQLGVTIPEVAAPLASYVPAVRTGNLVYTSGQLPTAEGRLQFEGLAGRDVSLDDAVRAARLACINALAAVKSITGDLEKVVRVVRVTGYVASEDGFTSQPQVVNGASDFLLDVFGERGKHARTAVGVAMLPRNSPVEIELLVEVEG
jgi:enamine deaminase RidA (YjgF/YER057c/UK114 family)